MSYGYFDKTKMEYVITRPDTPAPWVNYLGSPLYGAIVSNNAGGYSFVKSGAKGRILRYRFNSDDKPGRYIYIRHDVSKEYWSTSWQPVGKSEGYKNYCRHGLGYTTMETEYTGIYSETIYYVPLDQTYEIWIVKIKNNSSQERQLSIFGYAQFTNDSDYEQDRVNLQYSQFITKTYFRTNKIMQTINGNIKEKYPRFFDLVGAPIISYEGDKKSFIGNYHSYSNPKAIIDGRCGNVLNYNSDSCGALHAQFHLKPGEEKELLFILGQHNEVEEIISTYQDDEVGSSKAYKDLEELKKHWYSKLDGFKVDTPDDFSYIKETGHPAYRADDALWLFPTIKKYISETGDLGFWDMVTPYANKDEDSVYNHLKKAIEFSMNRLGNNGLPAGLHADWNDCLRLGKNGESTFVALQLYLALNILEEFSRIKNDKEYLTFLTQEKVQLAKKIKHLCFEDHRYIRGITEDGLLVSSKDNPEASMWLNPQSWAVISSIADDKQKEIILENVYHKLNTDYGARPMAPSFKNHAFLGALAAVYNGSTKENGGIFLQPQGWLILAEALAGHGNRAYEYYRESSPAHQNNIAELREIEPYVYSQFTESVESPFEGRSHVHWLTGAASTVMVGCIEGILGIRPDLKGILISPSIPSEWSKVTIEKNFRGKKLVLFIENKDNRESGYKEVYLNNVKLDSNYILESQLKEFNEILFYM